MLPYSKYYTKSNPGLWVLLTDESEESCQMINNFINTAIQLNWAGREVVSRCYIHILSYNGCIKRIASGDLSWYDLNPLRVEDLSKQVPDGDGGLVELKFKRSIWIPPQKSEIKQYNFSKVVEGIACFVKEWILANPQTPAPIVWNFADIESIGHSDWQYIDRLKDISTRDGNLLFINVSKKSENISLFDTSTPIAKHCSKLPTTEDFQRRILCLVEDFYVENDIELSVNSKYIDIWILVFIGWYSEPFFDISKRTILSLRNDDNISKSYQIQWTKHKPGRIFILIDRSDSMNDIQINGSALSEVVYKQLNQFINTIIQRNFDGRKPIDRCLITVIGYADKVDVLLSGTLSTIENNPIRMLIVDKKVGDGKGGYFEVQCKTPIWIEQNHLGSNQCNMDDAFGLVKEMIEGWINQHTDYPAPIIINVTNSEPASDKKKVIINIINSIRELNTKGGNVLIFNVTYNNGGRVIFPNTESVLNDKKSQFFYELSSEIPEDAANNAEKYDYILNEGCKGLLVNADISNVSHLFTFTYTPHRWWEE